MFIGHYGPAFAAKPLVRQIPLWVLFVAVQGLDFCWSALVLLGVEKVRIVPGFTQGSALDLYYMPYTHGLIGALILSAALGAIGLAFMRERRAAAFAVIAGAVFSHWLLDLHRARARPAAVRRSHESRPGALALDMDQPAARTRACCSPVLRSMRAPCRPGPGSAILALALRRRDGRCGALCAFGPPPPHPCRRGP